MHHIHERAEVRVGTTVCRARVGNGVVGIVAIGGCGRARLVGPVTVAALAVPVEVPAGRDHERNEVALLRTFIVRAGLVDEGVIDGGGSYGGAGDAAVTPAGARARARRTRPRYGGSTSGT